MKTLIRGAQHDKEHGKDNGSQGTIFDGILRSSLPPEELSLERLKDEAVSIIGAGITSAEWTSTLACFHIINDHHILERLRGELKSAIPDPRHLPFLTVLEKLPYLMACVEESRSYNHPCPFILRSHFLPVFVLPVDRWLDRHVSHVTRQ